MSAVVMVTGGAGFVGSHLVEALLERGDEVHVMDCVPLTEARNLATIAGHDRLHYTDASILDRGALERFFQPEASTVYHLASVVGVRHYMDDPLHLIDVVVGGTRAIVELCRERGVRMLFTSTSEIYGKNPAVPWSETGDRVLGPTSVDRWSYSTSKAVCEHMLYGVHRHSGWPFSIVRFFNVYGPRQNPIYVVSQSIYKALRGEAPFVYDDGRQTRCFTYVDDVVRGVLRVAEAEEAAGEAFNLGSQVESGIGEVVQVVLDTVGRDLSPVTFDTSVEYGAQYEDIPRRIPDTAKAREMLGWEATTSLAEGVAATVSWARENDWWLEDRGD